MNNRLHVFFRGAALALFCAVGTTSCVQYQKIRDIVDQSQQLALIAPGDALDNLPEHNGGVAVSASWTREGAKRLGQAIAKIDEFIEAYPDQVRTNDALRIRRATLYLSHRYFNLAKDSFEQVSSEDNLGGRDRALYRARDALVWWYKVSPSKSARPPKSEFEAMVGKLDAALDGLERSDARFLLAEIRADAIARMARTHLQGAAAGDALRAGLQAYSSEFTSTEQGHAAAFFKTPPVPAELKLIPLTSLRWIAHTAGVAKRYVNAARQIPVDRMGWDAGSSWLVNLAQ